VASRGGGVAVDKEVAASVNTEVEEPRRASEPQNAVPRRLSRCQSGNSERQSVPDVVLASDGRKLLASANPEAEPS
jgi:hypothetical protein